MIEIHALIRCFSICHRHCVPIILSNECELAVLSLLSTFHTVLICNAQMKRNLMTSLIHMCPA